LSVDVIGRVAQRFGGFDYLVRQQPTGAGLESHINPIGMSHPM